MYDMLYGLDSCDLNLIRVTWPHAIVQDATDAKHENRWSVQLPDGEREQWFLFLLRQQMGSISLLLQSMKRDKSQRAYLIGLLDKVRAELNPPAQQAPQQTSQDSP